MTITRAQTRAALVESIEHWRKIEDAEPPTNTSILIFVPNTEHYGPGIWRAILVDMGTGKRWTTFGWACGRDLRDEPTHWMPLPPSPEESAQ